MSVTKKDLQREQIAHAETKVLVEKLRNRIKELESIKPEVITKEVVVEKPVDKVVEKVVTKEVPVEKIRYVKVPDLMEVSEEEIIRAYEGLNK